MRHYSKLFKRVQAWVLTIAMLLPILNSGLLLTAVAVGDETQTKPVGSYYEGQIVAENYELTAAEKALLGSGLLIGKTIEIAKPDGSDGLVSVDEDTKAVSAKPYSDKGYTWVPVKVVYSFDGREVSVDIVDGKTEAPDGVGNAFSVLVTYQVSATVAEETQSALLNAAGYLKQSLINMEAINEASADLDTIQMAMDVLRQLADGMTMEFAGGASVTAQLGEEAVAAVEALETQMSANGERFDLTCVRDDYLASASKLEYVVENDVYGVFAATYAHIFTISEDSLLNNSILDAYLENKEPAKYTAWKAMKDIIGKWVASMQPYTDDGLWALYDQQVIADGLDAEDWIKLDEMLTEISVVTPAPAVKNPLTVDEVVIRHNMSMYNVDVKVVLETIENNKTVSREAETIQLTLLKGATPADIKAAILEKGIESDALAAWTAEGAYVEGRFEATATALPDALDSDVAYTITYSPKKYTVTYEFDGSATAELPYGWVITLPSHMGGMVYDYTVTKNGETVSCYQNDAVVVTDPLVINRTEGKAYDWTYSLNRVVGIVYYADNSDATAILNSGALLLGNEELKIRVPDGSWAVENVRIDEDDLVLTAPVYDSGYKGINWMPVSCDLYDRQGNVVKADIPVIDGKADLSAYLYDKAVVDYALVLNNFDSEDILELYNLPAVLSAEAASQISALKRLLNQEGNLEQLNRSVLGALKGVISTSDISDELKQEFDGIIAGLLKECMGSDSKLEIYSLISAYKNQGLAYYYKDYDNFKLAMSKLSGYLNDLVGTQEKREALKVLAAAVEKAEYAEKIENLQQSMSEINAALTAPNPLINMEAGTSLTALADALKNSDRMDTAEALPSVFALYTHCTAISPTQLATDITLQIGNSKLNVYMSFDREALLTAEDIQAIRNELNKQAQAVNGFYYTTDYDPSVLDAFVGKAADEVVLTFTWTPKTFKLVVPGYDQAIEFTVDKLQSSTLYVDLKPCTQTGFRYEYVIDGVTVEDGTYGFTAEQIERLFADGSYTVERIVVDETEERLIDFVDRLNQSVGNGAIRFALVKDAQEVSGYSIIMKMDGSSLGEMASAAGGMAMGFAESGYGYIALNDCTVLEFGEDDIPSISLQAVIDAIMNSGFSTDDLISAIHANGMTNHMDMPGTVLAGDMTQAGGRLMKLTMGLGNEAEGAMSLGFYVTVDQAGSELLKVRNLFADHLAQYVKVELADGKTTLHLTLPEKAYEAYLGALLVSGELDIRDVNAVNAEIAMGFLKDFVDPLLAGDASLQTVTNTLAAFGFDVDLSDYEKLFDKLCAQYKGMDIQYDEISATVEKTFGIESLLASVNVNENFLSMIKEINTGVTLVGSASLQQLSKDYQAVYVDLKAEGLTDKIGITDNVAYELLTMSGPAAVVLLRDVEGDLIIPYATVLNLNGFTVKGDVICNGNVIIVDSALDSVGGATGIVSGNATILAGRYAQDLSGTDFLKAGYEQKNGVVVNRFYSYEENETGDITIGLDAGILNTTDLPDVKFMLVDLAVDLFFNGYTTNQLHLDGYKVYEIVLEDLVGLYAGEDSVNTLIHKITEMIDTAGLAEIANAIMADLTDFEALQKAVSDGTPIASYDLLTGSWAVETSRVTDGDYFTIGLGSAHIRERKLNLVILGSDEDKQQLVELLGVLKDTTDVDVTVQMNHGFNSADGRDFTVSGGISTEIVMDFSHDAKYGILFGVLLADGLTGTVREDLVEGIRTYYEGGDLSIAELKQAFDAVTVAQFVTALESFARTDSLMGMIESLGLTEVVGEDVKALAELLNKSGVILGMIARSIDVTGNDRTLGSLYKSSLDGYGFERNDLNKSFSRELFKGYSVTLNAEISHVLVSVKIFDFTPVVKIDGEHDRLANTYIDDNQIALDVHENGMTVGDLKNMLSFIVSDGTQTGVKILDANGIECTDDRLVGTGFTVWVYTTRNDEGFSYGITVLGDLDGDGRISVADTFMMDAHYVYGTELTASQLNAMDLDRDGEYTLKDAYLFDYRYVYWDAYKGA